MIKTFILGLLLVSQISLAAPTQGTTMLITGTSHYANDIGEKIAQEGGNVVDVAVAVAFAMAVTNPFNASLGGGGFGMIHMNNKVQVLDFREVAPKATNAKYYENKVNDASVTSGTAVAVPGVPAGLWAMHKKFGSLPWKKLLLPAIHLADHGFRVNGYWVTATKNNETRFNNAGVTAFFKKPGVHYRPGELIKQKKLARALRKIRYENLKGFYEGEIAQDIVTSVQKSGGSLELVDMKNYKVRWLEPLTTDFAGYKVYLMPPPSSGGVVIKAALALIEKVNLKNYEPLSSEELHLLAEIQSRAFRGRSLLGDPDFGKNPLDKILSKKYLNEMANSIRIAKTTQLEPIKESDYISKESKETTHVTIMDIKGNAVTMTITLNGGYGSGVVSNKFGISLNNEMDDFTTRPNQPNIYGLVQGQLNSIEPGKRPLSSMSPTIVKKGAKVKLAIGAPGGPKIISGVLQALYRILVNEFDIDTAIQYPRIHHQFLPHTVFVNKNKFSPDVLEALKNKGHDVKISDWSSRVNGIYLRDDDVLEAAFDSREEGSVAGY